MSIPKQFSQRQAGNHELGSDYAFGDMVGVLAVAVTLIYDSIQIRDGTRATQAASFQTASSLDQEFLLAIGADSTTAQMWLTFLTEPQTLPEEQRMQCVFPMASLVRRLENVLHQRHLGSRSEEGWKSRQALFAGIARSWGYACLLNRRQRLS